MWFSNLWTFCVSVVDAKLEIYLFELFDQYNQDVTILGPLARADVVNYVDGSSFQYSI